MEKEFVSYELALKLKELGFGEKCLAFSYIKSEFSYTANKVYLIDYLDEASIVRNTNKDYYYARPLWQQAFDWFREKYKLHGWVVPYFTLVGINYSYLIMDENMRNLEDEVDVGTYQEARKACLEKLIEIVENDENFKVK